MKKLHLKHCPIRSRLTSLRPITVYMGNAENVCALTLKRTRLNVRMEIYKQGIVCGIQATCSVDPPLYLVQGVLLSSLTREIPTSPLHYTKI